MLMTNEELAQAIEVANQRVRACGTGQPNYEALLQHLKALLWEQQRRASAGVPVVAPAGPAWWQPVIVQPQWVPQPSYPVPPWTITCGPQ